MSSSGLQYALSGLKQKLEETRSSIYNLRDFTLPNFRVALREDLNGVCKALNNVEAKLDRFSELLEMDIALRTLELQQKTVQLEVNNNDEEKIEQPEVKQVEEKIIEQPKILQKTIQQPEVKISYASRKN